jgi:hypothetical protein
MGPSLRRGSGLSFLVTVALRPKGSLDVKPHLEPKTGFLLLQDSCVSAVFFILILGMKLRNGPYRKQLLQMLFLLFRAYSLPSNCSLVLLRTTLFIAPLPSSG